MRKHVDAAGIGLMTNWVASKIDEDPDRMLPREASMAKLFVTETAQKAAPAARPRVAVVPGSPDK
jgi:alkylation response protein AidB-like acyl-CoA dehydrogenase